MIPMQNEVVGTSNEKEVDNETQPLMCPRNSRRKSSISNTLNKFTPQSFHRRRTTADLGSISSFHPLPPSRLPTPAGIARSNSFFRNINSFSSKLAESVDKDKAGSSVAVKRAGKFWSNSASSTSSSQLSARRGKASTPFPSPDRSTQITQHSLMAPIHPEIPRSSTMGNLGKQKDSPRTPSFMRPTSSSAARRQSQSSGLGLSSGFGQSSSSRQLRSAARSLVEQVVRKICCTNGLEKEAKQ